MTTAALFPPKPKELERTVRMVFLTGALTGFILRTGSGTTQPVLGGTMLFFMAITERMASTTPAAARV